MQPLISRSFEFSIGLKDQAATQFTFTQFTGLKVKEVSKIPEENEIYCDDI